MFVTTKEEKALKKISETNPNFTVLSDFKGWRENIVRKCNICGDIKTVQARSLIEKSHGKLRGCMVCKQKQIGIKRRKTHQQFVDELQSINPNVKILSTYVTCNKKVKCQCMIDECIWETTPHSLLDGHGCPECARIKQHRRNKEEYLLELKEKHPTISVVGDFLRSGEKLQFKCNVCNYEWQTTANILLVQEGYGCPKCANHGRVSEQEVIERLSQRNPYVEYVSGYTTVSTHAIFKCVRCGKVWSALVSNVLSGRGCPDCNSRSSGELRVKDILNKLHIDYISEYKFDDCQYERPLPFDFYIPLYNICIEYDGEQHFRPTRFGNMTESESLERFKLQKQKDAIKTNYCKEHNINLIRIPYTEFDNVEQILNKYLS